MSPKQLGLNQEDFSSNSVPALPAFRGFTVASLLLVASLAYLGFWMVLQCAQDVISGENEQLRVAHRPDVSGPSVTAVHAAL